MVGGFQRRMTSVRRLMAARVLVPVVAALLAFLAPVSGSNFTRFVVGLALAQLGGVMLLRAGEPAWRVGVATVVVAAVYIGLAFAMLMGYLAAAGGPAGN